MQELEQPLVSIIVITYNSSKYVLETLESAKSQTYQNIELIISDDCSTDNTVEICREWIDENKEWFVRTELLTIVKNTGIAPNVNRGLYAAKGTWIKFIAGDDMLYNDCISKFCNEIFKNPQIEILFSNILENGSTSKTISSNLFSFFSLGSVEEQYLKLLEGNILPSPASFFKLSLLKQLNGFDERFPYFEDFPFYINALKAGKKFYYINENLVFYRVNNEGISNKKRMNINYQRNVKSFFKEIFLPELTVNKLHLFKLHYQTEYILLYLTGIGLIKYQRHYEFLLKYLSALFWQRRINKIRYNFKTKVFK